MSKHELYTVKLKITEQLNKYKNQILKCPNNIGT